MDSNGIGTDATIAQHITTIQVHFRYMRRHVLITSVGAEICFEE